MPGVLVDLKRRAAWVLDGERTVWVIGREFLMREGKSAYDTDVALPNWLDPRGEHQTTRLYCAGETWSVVYFLRWERANDGESIDHIYDEPRLLPEGGTVTHAGCELTFGTNGLPPSDRNKRRRGRTTPPQLAALQSGLNRAHAARERDPASAVSEYLRLSQEALRLASTEATYATRSLLKITREATVMDAVRETAESIVHDDADPAARWNAIEVLGVLRAGGCTAAIRLLNALGNSPTPWLCGLALAVSYPQPGLGQPKWVDPG